MFDHLTRRQDLTGEVSTCSLTRFRAWLLVKSGRPHVVQRGNQHRPSSSDKHTTAMQRRNLLIDSGVY